MTIQIKRVIAVTPDPTKIGGTINFMIVINQAPLNIHQVLGIEKNGNQFEVMYIHDTTQERFDAGQPIQSYYGLVFKDENQDILFSPNSEQIGSQYIGKFDLGGVTKHVFMVV